jgi:PST family polysaccharide transporter
MMPEPPETPPENPAETSDELPLPAREATSGEPAPTDLPEAREAVDLSHAVRRGTRWAFSAHIASQLIALGILAALYRLLRPEDYGLFAAALPAVMLPRMAATLGLGTALLQERDLDQSQKSGLFWLGLVLGLVAAAITAVCGPLLASTYKEPDLAPLLLALAGSTVLAALGNQHLALLERELKLREASLARFVALVAGGLAAIWTARRGAGVWALVAQQYAELAVLALWVWMLEPWRPGWPAPVAQLRKAIHFSTAYSASQLVNYAALNLEKVILPLVLAGQAERVLGLYSQAFNLMMRPVYSLTAPLTGVMVAGLAKAKDDAQRTELTARFFRLVGIGLFPCAAGLAATGSEVMLVLGGSNWREAGPLLALLAPAMVVQGFNNLAAYLLSSAGRAGRLLVAMSLLFVLLGQGMAAGIFFGRTTASGSAMAVAWGIAAAHAAVLVGVWLVPYLWFSLATAGLRPGTILRPLWPAFRAALLMGVGVWLLRGVLPPLNLPPAARLALLIAAGVALYSLAAWREVKWFSAEMNASRGVS